jgi:hypothetical protein
VALSVSIMNIGVSFRSTPRRFREGYSYYGRRDAKGNHRSPNSHARVRMRQAGKRRSR